MEHMPAIYDALCRADKEFGIANFGLYAVNSLRIEKAYRGWGAELTNEVTMIDAGMARFIKLDKGNFVGKDATLRQQRGDRNLQLVYFEIEADDSDVRGAEPIFLGDDCVGVTTSGGYGHFVQKSLGFGYVEPLNAEPDTELDTVGAGRKSAMENDWNARKRQWPDSGLRQTPQTGCLAPFIWC